MDDVPPEIQNDRKHGSLNFLLGLFGIVLGVFCQHAPWGNGFNGSGIFLGCIVFVFVVDRILRAATALNRWLRVPIATTIVIFLFGIFGYLSSRPDPQKTLAYMIDGPVPAGIQIHSVRCEWYDGQIYLARFKADRASLNEILSHKKYFPPDEFLQYPRTWTSSFLLAPIADASWLTAPSVARPEIYTTNGPDGSAGNFGKYSAILFDEDSGECWMMFVWT